MSPMEAGMVPLVEQVRRKRLFSVLMEKISSSGRTESSTSTPPMNLELSTFSFSSFCSWAIFGEMPPASSEVEIDRSLSSVFS